MIVVDSALITAAAMDSLDLPEVSTPIPPARALLNTAQLSSADRGKIAHANAERLLAL
ncbi:hypothetical protein [Catellatospora chokoriensis]|uniref:Uncharacterized protein n=1 Tax=Catellatospora chokoriensis TaxID=310353 RepID=A0A8J3K321_9ACTN|nr:hypothetical protein [Catellatospora chokoriensis]GIF93074.1 hypothetical protein Cch02nite_65180 [Catellatospora chokoriensis]